MRYEHLGREFLLDHIASQSQSQDWDQSQRQASQIDNNVTGNISQTVLSAQLRAEPHLPTYGEFPIHPEITAPAHE